MCRLPFLCGEVDRGGLCEGGGRGRVVAEAPGDIRTEYGESVRCCRTAPGSYRFIPKKWSWMPPRSTTAYGLGLFCWKVTSKPRAV